MFLPCTVVHYFSSTREGDENEKGERRVCVRE